MYRIEYQNKQYEFDTVTDCADVLCLSYASAWNLIYIRNGYIEKVIPADERSHRKTAHHDYRVESSVQRTRISIQKDWTQPYNILYEDGSEQQLHLCHTHLRTIIDMDTVINTTPIFGKEKQSCQWCDKLNNSV